MTNRTDAIKTALTALAATVTGHQTHAEALAGASENRADVAMQHGWDGVSLGYTTATENLHEIATEIESLREHLDRGADALDQIHDDTALTDVSTHLTTTDDHLDTAKASIEAVAVHLDDTRTHLESIGEEHITALLAALTDAIQAAAQTLTTIRDDITDERSVAATSTGGSGSGDAQATTDPVQARITELRRQGHTPQRHGQQITDHQLINRALWGKDPITGTTTDGDHGGVHQYSRNATKFTADAALVTAERYVRNSEEFTRQQRDNEVTGDARIRLEIPLQDIFGQDYRQHVRGIRRPGTKSKPTGDPPGTLTPTDTDFSDGTIFAFFRKATDGTYNLRTMYPRPRPANE